MIEVTEYTDPACSWAWGSEPKFRLLRWRYGDRLSWRRVMGGLVPNRAGREPGFDPVASAPATASYWSKVSDETGMPYPVELRHAPVSSEEACLAVKAAERQGEAQASKLLRRLREACFVFCDPADSVERILLLATGIDGLVVEGVRQDLDDTEVQRRYQEDWEETRSPNQYVLTLKEDQPGAGMAKYQDGRWRFVFPTLVFNGPGGEATVPGWKPYARYLEAMEKAEPGAADSPANAPTVERAFETWPLITEHELEVLSGTRTPPRGLVRFDNGSGPVWITEQEATVWAVRPG